MKAPLYTLILTVNTVLVMNAGIGGGDELPLWITLTALGLVAYALLYGNMKKSRE